VRGNDNDTHTLREKLESLRETCTQLAERRTTGNR
jgi:hypothetical protein